MHETLGDGYITDGGKRVYADEDIGTGRDATQLRHEEANSFQEEIANVIRAEGITLNAASETISQMNQLNTAIDQKVAAEASARVAADALLQDGVDLNAQAILDLEDVDIDNTSAISGATVKAALDTIDTDLTLLFNNDASLLALINTNTSNIATNTAAIAALAASDISNDSGVTGSTVKDALDNLDTNVGALAASDISNDSQIAGTNVDDALNKVNIRSWTTDMVNIFGSLSLGSFEGATAIENVGTTPGWSDLDPDDTVIVTKRVGSGSWTGTFESMVTLEGTVESNNQIKFGVGNPRNFGYSSSSNDQIIVRVIRTP